MFKYNPAQPASRRTFKSGRSNLLVYPRFQLKLVMVSAVILVLIFSFLGIQVARAIAEIRELAAQSGLPPQSTFFPYAELAAQKLYFHFIVTTAIGLSLSIGFILAITNRMAGPLLRLRRYFKELAEGQDPEWLMAFRRGDFFEELPGYVNAAVKRLREEQARRVPEPAPEAQAAAARESA